MCRASAQGSASLMKGELAAPAERCPPPSHPLVLPLSTLKRNVYNYVLTDFIVTSVPRRPGSTLISSSFLLFLGLDVLRKEAWILKLSFDEV